MFLCCFLFDSMCFVWSLCIVCGFYVFCLVCMLIYVVFGYFLFLFGCGYFFAGCRVK